MTILRNGALMTPEGPLNAALRMDGGKIAEIAPPNPARWGEGNDRASRWTIAAAYQRQNVDYTPYEGMEMEGRARLVYVSGVPAAQNGQPTGAVAGEYIKR